MRKASGLSRRFVVPGALALLLVCSGALRADKNGYETAFATDTQEQTAKEVFNPQTPKIYISYLLGDVPHTATLKAIWIAEKRLVWTPPSTLRSARAATDVSMCW